LPVALLFSAKLWPKILLSTPPEFFPTAALIKSLLINGAVDLKGQYSPNEAGPSPNVSSGWGRVKMTNSVNSIVIGSVTGPTGYLNGAPLNDEESNEFDVPITTSGATLKITLVWTDPPDAPGSGILQNDLNLVVNLGEGEQHGNTGSDVRNNVQQVRWSDVPEGTATVRITALHLTKSPQAYACAWSVS
jgi:serine protease AprX